MRAALAGVVLAGGLGLSVRLDRSSVTPGQPGERLAIVRLAGGGFSGYALGAAGRVWAWGDGIEGQLGDDLQGVFSSVPSPVRRLSGAVALAASANSAYALQRDGSVWSWGDDAAGELGDGQQGVVRALPVRVEGLRGVVALAGGSFSAYALGRDGRVWAWGDNAFGQLGQPLRVAGSSLPREVAGIEDVLQLSAGSSAAYALGRDGKVWAWGDNAFGELARPRRLVVSTAPEPVIGLGRTTALAAGSYSVFALESNGTVWSWGDGSAGELGDGSCRPAGRCGAVRRPVEVRGLHKVVAVAAGGDAAYALGSGGTLWAWGANTYGQLGNGSTAGSDLPVKVKVPGKVVAVAAGGDAAYALGSGGTLWAWGANTYGQLGNGSTAGSDLPVKVVALRLPNAEPVGPRPGGPRSAAG